MKKTFTILFIFLLTTFNINLLFGWGSWGHQHINRAAVFALPEGMRLFFYNHIDFITQESVIPDVRKSTDRAESNRHYIDLELLPATPGKAYPQTMKEAAATYGDSLLQKAGLLPWQIDEVTTRLTKAMQDKNASEILYYAADVAHYIGDAHMPFHTTANHDGQLTGQKGIHAFWESQLPEKFGDTYNFHTEDAVYIPDVKKEIWRIIGNSFTLVDTVLQTDKKLMAHFPADQVYEKDAAGSIIKNKYNQTRHSDAYATQFHDLSHGLVEQQMRLAITAVSNFWYTAWVNAGKPDLAALDASSLGKRNSRFLKNDYRLWRKGRLSGLKTAAEF